MKIYSKNINNDWIDTEFGQNTSEPLQHKMVTKSFHIGWDDLPAGTKSIAITFIDHDAIPVCGFTWIHWIACNIDPNMKELPVNASIEHSDKMVQGKNSWHSGLLPESMREQKLHLFGGCAPPDKDHEYKIKVYALDTMLDLQEGYHLNEFKKAKKGHVLAKAKIKAKYPKLK